MDLRILPPEGLLETSLKLPLSKSMSARAIIINALTPGSAPLEHVAECDDTQALTQALYGPGAQERGHRRVDVGAAGTTMRFLTAYYAATPGADVTLDGTERMRQRPIGLLVDALRQLGADITYEGAEGFPPLHIRGRRLEGGSVELDATVSSQYISALLMTAPAMARGLELHLRGDITSLPYIRMTLAMMQRMGGVEGTFTAGPGGTVTVPPATYTLPAAPVGIEGDWSAAAAWYETVALSAGIVSIDNLQSDSCQGDRCLSRLMERLGVDTLWEGLGHDSITYLTPNPDADARAAIDFSDCPDLAQYITVTCVMLGIPFSFTGLHTLAIKETDRIEALRAELLKTGAVLESPAPGTLEWDGRRHPIQEMPVFETYHDHRMAMALAPVALYIPGIVIRDAQVVTKSYPGYWHDMRAAGFTLLDAALDPPAEAAL